MADLPIRRVVLYKHGVGYFEREAAVSGDQPLTLSFKQREVSDVLKSLTVLDLDGGTVSAVGYDSTTPVEQLLAEIALAIPDNGSLVGLLPQIKGARVSATPTGGAAVQGAVLGIDRQDVRGDGVITHKALLSLLTDAGEVRTFDLFDLDLAILDEGIRRDLDFYLRTQLASKKKDARTFTLFAQGEGTRRVRVSYVLEAPVWKATYRLLLEEPSPLIQGWAVVDNTSDEDWQEVDLTLVAGLPVSFTHDLYTPRYVRRPVVEVKETTGVLPPVAEAGVGADDEDGDDDEVTELAAFAPASVASPKVAARARKAYAGGGYGGAAAARASAVSSVQAQTRERQVGDLFEYGIETPVTVRRNQSALVPILLKPFAGRPVLLYQKAARAENPMRCVEFENTTGLTLEGGPVTVLEGGSYAGEAMLDTMKPAEKRLVGFAVELAVRVFDNFDTRSDRVSRVTIRNGALNTHYAQVLQTTYTFNSKSQKEQVLYLDHPRDGSRWALADAAKPHETTENYWRFRLTLPAGAVTTFVVRQQQTLQQTWGLAEISDKLLGAWVSASYLDKPTLKALKEALARRQEAARVEARLARLAEERNTIHAEQKRIRENLGALGDRASEKGLRERFVATLGKQEDRLGAIAGEEETLRADRDAARAALAELIGKLEYDAPVAG